jgi:hypothetical protein
VIFFFRDFLKKVAQKIFRDALASHPCAESCFFSGGRFLKPPVLHEVQQFFVLFPTLESSLSEIGNKTKNVTGFACRRFQKQRAGKINFA